MKKIAAFLLTIVVLIGLSLVISRLAESRKEKYVPPATVWQNNEEMTVRQIENVEEPNLPEQERDPAVEKILRSMTTWEKVGQLFIVRPESLQPGLQWKLDHGVVEEGIQYLSESECEMLKYYPVGGFCFFQTNIVSAEQMHTLMTQLSEASTVPLIFSVDEEGGPVARIANSGAFYVTKYRNMSYLADLGITDNAKDAGYIIGNYLKELGFNLDFAPVADVNTNPQNVVIGVRAFGSDPYLAARMVAAEVEGFQLADVGCTLKHFPGHGDTSTDTHTGAAYSYKTWEEMLRCEMIPFISGIRAGADAVMVSHISVPNITGTSVPSSLSYMIVTEKLRNELGFEGLILTDSMEMSAVTQYMNAGSAAVKALRAGVDVILMPDDLEEAYEAIYNAVKMGSISVKELDEHVARIIAYKMKYGLLNED